MTLFQTENPVVLYAWADTRGNSLKIRSIRSFSSSLNFTSNLLINQQMTHCVVKIMSQILNWDFKNTLDPQMLERWYWYLKLDALEGSLDIQTLKGISLGDYSQILREGRKNIYFLECFLRK